MKRKLKVALALLLLATAVSSAIATVYFVRTITNTATIKGAWNIQLFRWDTQSFITDIQWGQIDPGTSISTNQLFSGTCLKLKNIGNTEGHIAWLLDPATPLPTGVSLTARYENSPGSMIALPQNDYSVIDIGPGQFSGGPDVQPGRVEWTLAIDQYAPAASFNFNILLKAADTSSG